MAKVAKSMPAADVLRLRSTCALWNRTFTAELRSDRRCRGDAPWVQLRGDSAQITSRMEQLAETLLTRTCASPSESVSPLTKLFIFARKDCYCDASRALFSLAPVQDLFSVWGGSHLTRLELHVLPSEHGNKAMSAFGLRRILFNLTPALQELKLLWWCALDTNEGNGVEVDTGMEDGEWEWKELPALRRLDLRMGNAWRTLEETETSSLCVTLTRDLLRAATRLQALRTDGQSTPSALQFMLDLSAPLYPLLTEFDFEFRYGSDLPRLVEWAEARERAARHGLLTKVGMKVTVFSHNPQATPQACEFLALQAPHLRHLILDMTYVECSVIPPFEVPNLTLLRMAALETLTTNSGKPQHIHFDADVGVDERGFPNLKSLTFERNYAPLDYTYTPEWITDPPCDLLWTLAGSPITVLTVNTPWNLSTPEMVQCMATHFPGVVRLKIAVRRLCMRHVLIGWPALQVLDVTVVVARKDGAICLDPDLTGIDAEHCDGLRERIEGVDGGKDGVGVDQEEARRLKSTPGLTDLCHLCEFRLKWQPDTRQYPVLPFAAQERLITDVTGYYAFATPGSRLQRISVVTKVPRSRLSEPCRHAITKKMGIRGVLEIL